MYKRDVTSYNTKELERTFWKTEEQ